MNNALTMNEEEVREAKDLATQRRWLQLADLSLGFAFLTGMIVSEGAIALGQWVRSLTDSWAGQIAIFLLAFGGLYSLIAFPLTFYGDYWLMKRYGILKQSFASWIGDEAKGLVLSAMIGIPLMIGLYALLATWPTSWAPFAIAGYAVFSLIGIVLVPVVIMPLFAKYTPLEDPDLVARLQALGEKAGTKITGVYRWGLAEKSAQANAALTGIGATRRIIISDTMLDNYSADEIEAVMAHELGHQVHADIWRMWVVGMSIMGAAFWVAQFLLLKTTLYWGFAGPSDIAALPVLLLVLSSATLLALPLINAYSRSREWAADRFALDLSGKGKFLISALERLGKQNKSDPSPPWFIEMLLYSHPSLNRRLAVLRDRVSSEG